MTTWATRIRDLQAIGMTLAEIAEATGLAVSSIGDIASGRTKSPNADAGIKLHELHQLRCPDDASAAASG